MLQRSQTLYLLGVFFLSLFLFTGPLALITLEGGELILKNSGVFDMEGMKMDVATWPLTLFFILVAVLIFLTIFSYKNRVRQMRLCVFLMLLNAGMVVLVFYYIYFIRMKFDGLQTIHQWRIVLPAIAIILIYLAFRRIRRDELLVKAYDRIR
ncbi:MAG: DUF4293 domain-containing protein [Bacteroidales bacterium]|nr:DUF4293 domain-containing protein [Bacteroidales bacterium]